MNSSAAAALTSTTPAALSVAHELRTLVLSRHPAIAIETTEEDRVDTQLAELAARTGLTMFEWTITRGLVRQPGTAPMYGTNDPARCWPTWPSLTVEGLFVLKDFDAHLGTPAVSRAFRELLERFGSPSRRSTFVLLGATMELPARSRPRSSATSCGCPATRSTARPSPRWWSRCG